MAPANPEADEANGIALSHHPGERREGGGRGHWREEAVGSEADELAVRHLLTSARPSRRRWWLGWGRSRRRWPGGGGAVAEEALVREEEAAGGRRGPPQCRRAFRALAASDLHFRRKTN
ncbi:hypothetical protein SEVIR_6G235051v4 [Setaria viridis]